MSSVIECPRTDDTFSLESAIIYEYGYTLQCITQYGSTVYIGMAMGGSAL